MNVVSGYNNRLANVTSCRGQGVRTGGPTMLLNEGLASHGLADPALSRFGKIRLDRRVI